MLPPRPSKPLGHVGGGVWGLVVSDFDFAFPSEAHWHVGVQVDGSGSGWEESEVGWEADFAFGWGHVYAEVSQIQTPDHFTSCLELKIRSLVRSIFIVTANMLMERL